MTIFVNVPVADVARSTAFFSALGWPADERFASEHGAAFAIAPDQFLMVSERAFMASMIQSGKALGDPATSVYGAIAFDVPSRAELEALIARVEAAGGRLDPLEDHGFMVQQGFDDPDGNHFEPFWMDPAA